ncbi:formate hydrogenlyase subunit 3 [Thermoplasma volcanium GSS1]|uniref:Formate hydrogenlyase subunit 3 n=1 Tax=Thermoplasma volcanium (strain ATCC 51530 / DSM 4299 / JCM 9571 / NBRC 15438 / GSS1) TaxID=273116 RepID=Q978D6_THEVO|nr:nickel-dependent hydrogenase large subunit [Thermoplasma volcanium]BAB60623.1 formate hydrogenlyase subunit 3 [Thermoplasma volcanium GSS1]
MKYYRFGKPEGRFVGNTEKYSVYEHILSDQRREIPSESYRNLPGEFTFNYGPATGGLIESVAFDFHTPGELIKHVDVYPYIKTRKIKVRGLSPEDALLLVERINGFHAASHAVAFEMAVEDALNIDVPEEVQYSRIIMLELERMRSNLEVVKRLCEPAGFGVPQNQIAYLRENIARIITSFAGHRYFFSSSYVGGCQFNGLVLESVIEDVKEEFEGIFNDLLQSKIFLNRLQNNGKISSSDMLGPAARAAGIEVDARIDEKRLPYSKLGFKPIVFDEPDAFGRFYVRSKEILSSADLISKAIRFSGNSPPAKIEKTNGEGAARVESPQGDLFYYVKINDGKISDVQISSPSLLNIEAFKKSMIGNIFTDYHFNWESFGIWVSELAVVIQ